MKFWAQWIAGVMFFGLAMFAPDSWYSTTEEHRAMQKLDLLLVSSIILCVAMNSKD